MKRKKVVLLMPSMLCQRWVENYCLDTLDAMFNFEYWDCTAFTFPSLVYDSNIERPYLKKIGSLNNLKKELEFLPADTIVCSDIHLTRENFKIHKTISRYFRKIIVFTFWDNEENLHYVRFKNDAEPVYEYRQLTDGADEKGTRIQRAIKILFPEQSCRTILGKIRHNISLIGEIIRVSKMLIRVDWEKRNRDLYEELIFVGAASFRKYRINLPDVERYLRAKDVETYSARYVVFIDEYFPRHPDLRMYEKTEHIKSIEDIYYNSLNKLFKHVEKQLSCEVVIAAHPSAYYMENKFNGRKLIKNMTCELVRDSIGVILHESCSISYAMLFDKPIMIVINNAIKQVEFTYALVLRMAKVLGLNIIDTDNCQPENIKFSKVSDVRREFYLNKILCVEDASIIPNTERIPQCMNAIYKDIYEKNNA